jgi:GNAT superfamily N-acetyltransferase
METILIVEDDPAMLKFEPIIKFERGLVFRLLSQSFAEFLNDELEEKIKQFDKESFGNPDTVGKCVFVSTLNGEAVGMASWDPRQGPKVGIIGWNCVLPKHRGQGIGITQIEEILKRFRSSGFEKAFVKTGEHSFFEAARRMYRRCGFSISKRHQAGDQPGYGTIDYEIKLQ